MIRIRNHIQREYINSLPSEFSLFKGTIAGGLLRVFVFFFHPHCPLALLVSRDLIYSGHGWLDEDVSQIAIGQMGCRSKD